MFLEKNATEEDSVELEIETVILEDEVTGEVFKCDVLDIIELEGKTYAVILPEEEDNTVVILEIKKENDGEYYEAVEDDILEEVYQIFEARNPEYFTDSER